MGPKLCQTASHQLLWTMASHDHRRYVESYSVLPWHNVVKRCIIGEHTLCQKMGRRWRKKGRQGRDVPFLLKLSKFCSVSRRKEQDFCLFFFHLRKKMTNQQSLSWFGFARGCDRAVKDFMGHCPMIHWVIGFRPVLIADVPEPKNLGGFRRVLFSTIQQNGIWSASASRHSRRPSQFRGP